MRPRDSLLMQPNPLLAQPPEQYHKLRNTQRFRQVMGRAPLASDYHGVHTTDSAAAAAAYAISAWILRGERSDDMPVLIRLSTGGLEPLADVDAMLSGGELYDAIRPEVVKMLRDGDSVEDIERAFDDYTVDSEFAELVGLDPAEVIFEDITCGANPITTLLEYGGDNAVRRLANGEPLPDRVLSEVVRQRRFLFDFDIDRVVAIDAVRPWWWEIVNEDDERTVSAIEATGWDVITFEDAASGDIRPKLKVIWGVMRGGEENYHGTTIGVVRAAFPGIQLDDGFAIAPRASVNVAMRGAAVDPDQEEG